MQLHYAHRLSYNMDMSGAILEQTIENKYVPKKFFVFFALPGIRFCRDRIKRSGSNFQKSMNIPNRIDSPNLAIVQ